MLKSELHYQEAIKDAREQLTALADSLLSKLSNDDSGVSTLFTYLTTTRKQDQAIKQKINEEMDKDFHAKNQAVDPLVKNILFAIMELLLLERCLTKVTVGGKKWKPSGEKQDVYLSYVKEIKEENVTKMATKYWNKENPSLHRTQVVVNKIPHAVGIAVGAVFTTLSVTTWLNVSEKTITMREEVPAFFFLIGYIIGYCLAKLLLKPAALLLKKSTEPKDNAPERIKHKTSFFSSAPSPKEPEAQTSPALFAKTYYNIC